MRCVGGAWEKMVLFILEAAISKQCSGMLQTQFSTSESKSLACLIFIDSSPLKFLGLTAASQWGHVPRRRLLGETRREFSARHAWLMGARCVPSKQGGQVEAMNKVRRDRSDDVWSRPAGDELAIPCRRKTPITISEAHTLKDRRYFHHFDNTKMESGSDLEALVLLGAERVCGEELTDARIHG